MTSDYLSGQRLHRDVVFYGRLGEHRVGTDADRRTAGWIAERLALAGLRVESQPWATRQFFVERAELRAAGETVECFPLWFPRATGPQPIVAPLAPFRAEQGADFPAGRIAVGEVDATHAGDRPLACERIVAAAARAGAAAVVLVTEGPSGEIFAFNQEHHEPLPLPTVLVAPRDRPILAAAIASSAPGSLLIVGRDEPGARARNVLGCHDGGERTIVVSTPTTGWFGCGGERGPGIALFLALARWVGERRPAVRYVFTANAGHELGNLGMRHFVASGAVAPGEVIGWLHLGASIGTIGWGGLGGAARARTLGATPALLPALAAAFAGLPHLEAVEGPLGGEIPHVLAAGYERVVGIAGRFPTFHTRADHPETATTPGLLEPIAAALTRLLERMERG